MDRVAFFAAVLNGDDVAVDDALDDGFPVDARNRAGFTALHRAAANGRMRVMEVLLRHGAPVDLKAKGQTPAQAAARAGHGAAVARLIAAGATPPRPSNTGIVARSHKRPPRCLEGLSPTPMLEYVIDGLGPEFMDDTAWFSLACPCGEEVFTVTGEVDAGFLSEVGDACLHDCLDRIWLTCVGCDREALVFDPAQHGYDAEVDREEGLALSIGEGLEPVIWGCGICGERHGKVLTGFAYPEDPDTYRGRTGPDRFEVFILRLTCGACGAVERPVGASCA